VPQEGNDIADRSEADPHHNRIARAVDELEDRAAVEAGCGRPCDLDVEVIDQTPREARRRNRGSASRSRTVSVAPAGSATG